MAKRSRKLANALENLGLKKGDTVGTLAWNTLGILNYILVSQE